MFCKKRGTQSWALVSATTIHPSICSDFCSKVLQLRQFNLHLCSKGSRNGTTTAVFVCWFVCFGSDWWTVIWQTHTDGQTQWKQSHTRALIASLLKHRKGTNQVWAPLLFLPSNGGNKGSWGSSHQLLNRWPDWLEGISCLMVAVCQSLLHMLTEDVRLLHADKSDSHAQAAFLFQRPGMLWWGCHRAWI